ncbi:MAG: hypothetical protein H7328_07610 [Bdellovibrio sp.]|nr:hypothetical protein [Bdellovibrio sp.]
MFNLYSYSLKNLIFLVFLFLSACATAEQSSSEVTLPIANSSNLTTEAESIPREPQSKGPTPSIQNTHNPQIAGPNNCARAAYPDSKYTPGATFINLTEKQLCTPGYTATVRNVTNKEARQVFVNYGIEAKYLTKERGNYEVDHFISLELGGSNDVANL